MVDQSRRTTSRIRRLTRGHRSNNSPHVSLPGSYWLLVIGIGIAVVSKPSVAQAAKVHGAFILDESVKVDKSRYKSKKDWDRTLRFFGSVYRGKPGIVFRKIASPPKVEAFYIENTNPNQGWEGINIYETSAGIFIYVIENQHVGTAKAAPESTDRKGGPSKKRK